LQSDLHKQNQILL